MCPYRVFERVHVTLDATACHVMALPRVVADLDRFGSGAADRPDRVGPGSRT